MVQASQVVLQVQSLGWEDPLEKGMTAYSSILAWRIQSTEEPGRIQSIGSQRVRHNRSDLAQHNLKYKNSDYSWEDRGKGWIGK